MKTTTATALALLFGLGLALPAAAQQQEQQLFYPPPGVTGPSWGAPGYWWRGPNRFGQAEPSALSELFGEQFRRGYELGRIEERTARQGGQQQMPSVNWVVNPEYAGSAQISPRLPDEATMLRVRDALQRAKQALQQGETPQAEEALAEVDRMLEDGKRDRIQQAITEAERALQQDDTEAARRALRQVRQTLVQEGQQQATAASGRPTGPQQQ